MQYFFKSNGTNSHVNMGAFMNISPLLSQCMMSSVTVLQKNGESVDVSSSKGTVSSGNDLCMKLG